MVPELVKLLAHEVRWVRVTAAKVLGKIGGERATRALRHRLEIEKDTRVLKRILALETTGPIPIA